MARVRLSLVLILTALLFAAMALLFAPARAQTADAPVVRAVVFTSHICSFCREIVEQDMIAAIQKFGSQLELLIVDVDTSPGKALYEAALEAYAVPRGVPLVFIGEHTLGGVNILPDLPGLVQNALDAGGLDWPDLPGLTDYLTALETEKAQAALKTPVPAVVGESGVVHAVLFWMEGCPHCSEVIQNTLAPLEAQYGAQLDVQKIEVFSIDDINKLYRLGKAYGMTQEQIGVPLVIIGKHTLMGSDQIPARLPGLVEEYLAAGGVGLPDIQPFAAALLLPTPPPGVPVVYLMLFWTPDCKSCQTILSTAITPLYKQYGEQVYVQYVDVVNGNDVERFYRIAAAFGIQQEQAHLPMVLVADQALVGEEQILAELPGAVDTALTSGGADMPDLALLLHGGGAAATLPAGQPDGYGLALGVLVFLLATLLYALVALFWKKLPLPPRSWTDVLLPLLAVLGLGVAAYLSYVETQAVEAICGPVGDCNAVQASIYARLFGFLPVGVLGMLGYMLILVVWTWKQVRSDRFANLVKAALFSMALVGVFFSIYLTYLELFIIQAVCLWCLSSAVIMSLVLLLTPPQTRPILRKVEKM